MLVCITLALGTVAALARHYVGYAERYQQEIAAELARRTGLRVEIGRLRGSWQELAPQLDIQDLRLYNPAAPDAPVVAMEALTLRLGLFHSINEGTLVFHRVAGRGLHLHLDEVALGQWRLRGLPQRGGGDVDALVDMLLAVHRARFEESHIALRFFDGGGTQVDGALTLERSRRFRRIGIDMQVASGAPIRLTVEAKGDPRRRRFSADAYAEFSDLDLSPLLPAAKAYGLNLEHGRLDGRAWLRLQRGLLTVRGTLAAPELDLAALTGRDLPPLIELSSEFLLEQRPGQRQLWVPRLQARWTDRRIDLRHLLLSQHAQEPDRFRAALPRLALAPLRDLLLDTGLLPAEQREALSELAPTGELQRLQLVLPMSPQRRELFRLSAELHGISLQPWRSAPGVAGLSGYLDTGIDSGEALLRGDDLHLAFPQIYQQPLQFDRGQAAVSWRLDGGRLLLQSGVIRLRSDAGRGSAQVALDLPLQHDEERPPAMTLLVGMRDSDARFRHRFIPAFLRPELLDWLRDSIRGGRLREGGFLYHGSLRAGDHSRRTVQLHLAVEQGELVYRAPWPTLHDATGSLWLDDAHLQVALSHGRLYDTIELQPTRITLEPAADSGSWLTLSGSARGRDEDLLRLLRETPLRSQSAWLDGWQWRGDARAEFALGVPIGSQRPAEIAIDAQLETGTLTRADRDLTVTRLHGPLTYRSGRGISSTGIAGRFDGQPLRLTAGRHQGRQMVTAKAGVSAATLRRLHPSPLLTHLHGKALVNARLTLDGEASRLRLDSDLKGLRIALPEPYRKSAQESLPLHIDVALRSARRLQATLGEWAELTLDWTGPDTLESGVLLLGRTGAVSARPGELAIGGHLPPLEFSAWSALLGGGGGDADVGGLRPALHALYCPELTLRSLRLVDIQISGRRIREGWQLYASSDRVSGALLLPAEPQQPWQLHIEALRLPAVEPDAPPAEWLADIDPSALPTADVRIDALWRGDRNWGTVAFQLRPQTGGLQLRQLSGTLRDVRIRGRDKRPASLVWQRVDGVDSTRFDGRLTVGDLGGVLAQWQYEPAVTTRNGQLDVDLGWRGRPDQFALRLLDGDAALTLRDGRFLKAGASTEGALKVVGVFNFANLLRRLQLDFTDLFRDGISFDRIDGRFGVHSGIVELTSPLAIRGPSSRFRMLGSLDFNTDQVAMELTATLPLSGNLPWLAALAGGLPAAAGVYVASRLFGDQVDRVASAVYEVSGSWRDPEVRFRRLFDDRLDAQPGSASTPTEESP